MKAHQGPPTRVTRLTGRLHELGAFLEHAPHGYVYVGRPMFQGGWRLDGSVWANPFRAQQVGGAARAVAVFAAWLDDAPQAALRAQIVPQLRGRTLCCWCKPGPCHARLLAAWADHGRRPPVGLPRPPGPAPGPGEPGRAADRP